LCLSEFIVDDVPAVAAAVPLEFEFSTVAEAEEATSISPRSVTGFVVDVVATAAVAASLEAASPEPLSPAELSVLEAMLAALAWDKSLAELLTFITPPLLEDAEPSPAAKASSEPSGII
jgi:hypothetical protein